ncbi:MAG: 4Fe-4S binding protein [Fibrobacter sp.]|nr:4Fe-4S binding protein [Fibrobacter sp.]
MRTFRVISQIFFFLSFLFLFFFLNRNPAAYRWDSEILLWANPLTGLLTTIASRSFYVPIAVTAAAIMILTALFGRFFCGFFCPLGSIIDFLDKFIFEKMRSAGRRIPGFFRRIKYVLLIVLIVLAMFGSFFPLIADPLTITTRFLTVLVNPVLSVFGVDLLNLTGWIWPPVVERISGFFSSAVPLYYGVILTVILLLLVTAGGFWQKRFWCANICPTGAFLGLLSRFTFFRRAVNAAKCNSCSRCAAVCPTGTIDKKNVSGTDVSECIECGVCVELKDGCSSFQLLRPQFTGGSGPDLQRRHLLAGVAGGVLMLPVFRATAINKRDDHGRLIRPPGALPEEKFLARCSGCGECMKVCPTNGLQPCMFTDGFSRLYTPKLVPRIGGCEEKCSLCGNVCPNGAIRKLPLEEKQFAKIGTAVIDRHKCLAWAQNRECLVCDEVCPYNAIEFRMVDTVKGRFKVPVVFEDLCAGCGLCEQNCPIFDQAAIVVYKFGENRRESGEYASVWQKEVIRERRRKSDSVHLDNELDYAGESGEVSEGFSDGFIE